MKEKHVLRAWHEDNRVEATTMTLVQWVVIHNFGLGKGGFG